MSYAVQRACCGLAAVCSALLVLLSSRPDPAASEASVAPVEIQVTSIGVAAPPQKPTPALAAHMASAGARSEAGAFPGIRARFDGVSWMTYRDRMLELGGAFFLYDAGASGEDGNLVARIDPRTGTILPAGSLDGLSPVPRDVTSHLRHIISRVRSQVPRPVTHVVLLPAEHVDHVIMREGLSQLDARGIDSADVVLVEGRWFIQKGQLHFGIEAVRTSAGKRVETAVAVSMEARPS